MTFDLLEFIYSFAGYILEFIGFLATLSDGGGDTLTLNVYYFVDISVLGYLL